MITVCQADLSNVAVSVRACPSSKLGQQKHRGVHLPLSAIHPAGGLVPQTDVVIQRKGPVLIWARAPDGTAFMRTQKAYAQDAKRQEAHVCQVGFMKRCTPPDMHLCMSNEQASKCRNEIYSARNLPLYRCLLHS